jgi:hypothetical protein
MPKASSLSSINSILNSSDSHEKLSREQRQFAESVGAALAQFWIKHRSPPSGEQTQTQDAVDNVDGDPPSKVNNGCRLVAVL